MNLESINKPILSFYLFIYLSLLNYPISNSDYVASDWIIVNTEFEMIWKEIS